MRSAHTILVRALCGCTLSMLLTITSVNSATPQLISYQGRLTNDSGQPFDTTVTIVFALFDDSTGSGVVWYEIHPDVVVENGLFNVRLGQFEELDAGMFDDTLLFLAANVGGEVIEPRWRLVSVPWAFRVSTVDAASGGQIIGSLSATGLGEIGPQTSNDGFNCTAIGSADTVAGSYGTAVGGRQNKSVGFGSSVVGGSFNQVTGSHAGVFSGESNEAHGSHASVTGGFDNIGFGDFSVVSGGNADSAYGMYGVVAGGVGNRAGNDALDSCIVIGGGWKNKATASFATIAGGWDNEVTHAQSTIGGGIGNVVGARYATVAGGSFNTIEGEYSGILSGDDNEITGYGSVICGGSNNIDSSNYDIICGGTDNTIRSGFFGNVIVGGQSNEISGRRSFIGSGNENSIQADNAVIAGGGLNNNEGNLATIGGGYINEIRGELSTIAGGYYNIVDADFGFVGGGDGNRVSADSLSVVVGGQENEAAGNMSFVGGGRQNYAGGKFSCILGNWADTITANAEHSYAFGDRVYLNQPYRAAFFQGPIPGFIGINRDNHGSTTIDHPIHVGTNAGNGNGAYLSAGGTWTNSSSRDVKENFEELDGDEILERISSLNIQAWTYKDTRERHIGPVAEEFVSAFDVGASDQDSHARDNKHLAPADAAGVALRAIQQLYAELQEKDKRIKSLEQQVLELRELILESEAR